MPFDLSDLGTPKVFMSNRQTSKGGGKAKDLPAVLSKLLEGYDNTPEVFKPKQLRDFFRPSGLPFCASAYLHMPASVLEKPEATKSFYTSIGTAVHRSLQRYAADAGFLSFYNGRQNGLVTAPLKGMQYNEPTFSASYKGVVLSGSVDLIEQLDDGSLHLIDIKTCTSPQQKRGTEAHRAQLSAYRFLVNYHEATFERQHPSVGVSPRRVSKTSLLFVDRGAGLLGNNPAHLVEVDTSDYKAFMKQQFEQAVMAQEGDKAKAHAARPCQCPATFSRHHRGKFTTCPFRAVCVGV